MLPDCDNSRAWTVTLWPIGTTAQSAAAIPQVQAVKIIGTSADRAKGAVRLRKLLEIKRMSMSAVARGKGFLSASTKRSQRLPSNREFNPASACRG
jgi:hypothetical protein